MKRAVASGAAGAPYEAGWLALREGALLEAAMSALPRTPDVLLVDATGRDRPQRAGIALHLGAVLELPTGGVTHRPLLARGDCPEDKPGAQSPLLPAEALVGYRVRTKRGCRPLAVHAAWRMTLARRPRLSLPASGGCESLEPLRRACEAARSAGATDGGIVAAG